MARARVLLFFALGALAFGGCAKKSGEVTVLQAEDLATNAGAAPFDPNEIVDTASFTDGLGLDPATVQSFLEHTPYGTRPSFLSTYQSNGVLASDAIVRVAQAFHLNPLVFLVRAEMAEGLLGDQTYPLPPSQVEYVFGCGCAAAGQCDPMLAGFDRQVDCLARALRASLDEIAKSGATAGGWAPGQPGTTFDGQTVTPKDAATAALYQYLPVVGTGSGGNWLFWNIWQNYALATNYAGPAGGPAGGTAAIGDGCNTPGDCADPGALCATGQNYPGGLCTLPCTGNDCPPSATGTFCADFKQNGYCLAVCDPTVPASCRQGYKCIRVHRFGASNPNDAQNVCFAQ